jgi:hypothetical protein
VQLVLGTPSNPALVDTLVMSNLGYFQLKAAPGAYDLQLAPGRSRDLYVVDNSTAGVAQQARYRPPRGDTDADKTLSCMKDCPLVTWRSVSISATAADARRDLMFVMSLGTESGGRGAGEGHGRDRQPRRQAHAPAPAQAPGLRGRGRAGRGR